MRIVILCSFAGLILFSASAPASAQSAPKGAAPEQIELDDSPAVAVNRKRRGESEDQKAGRLDRAIERALGDSERRINADRRDNEQDRDRLARDIRRGRGPAGRPSEVLREIDSRYQELESERRVIEDQQRGRRMARTRTPTPLGGGHHGLQRLYLESLR